MSSCCGRVRGEDTDKGLTEDGKLHYFMWPGEYTTFGEILKVVGGTQR